MPTADSATIRCARDRSISRRRPFCTGAGVIIQTTNSSDHSQGFTPDCATHSRRAAGRNRPFPGCSRLRLFLELPQVVTVVPVAGDSASSRLSRRPAFPSKPRPVPFKPAVDEFTAAENHPARQVLHAAQELFGYLDVDVLLASMPDTRYLGRLYQDEMAQEAVPNKNEHDENEPLRTDSHQGIQSTAS